MNRDNINDNVSLVIEDLEYVLDFLESKFEVSNILAKGRILAAILLLTKIKENKLSGDIKNVTTLLPEIIDSFKYFKTCIDNRIWCVDNAISHIKDDFSYKESIQNSMKDLKSFIDTQERVLDNLIIFLKGE